MTSIRDLPIRQKLVAIIMIISAAALILASGVLITYDFITSRQDLRISTTTMARIIAIPAWRRRLASVSNLGRRSNATRVSHRRGS